VAFETSSNGSQLQPTVLIVSYAPSRFDSDRTAVADRRTKERRSWNTSRVRGKNTTPEKRNSTSASSDQKIRRQKDSVVQIKSPAFKPNLGRNLNPNGISQVSPMLLAETA
jgi:hypothetical protein